MTDFHFSQSAPNSAPEARIAQLEKERAELLVALQQVTDAATAVVTRWHSGDWKDLPPIGDYINRLRDVVNTRPAANAGGREPFTFDTFMDHCERTGLTLQPITPAAADAVAVPRTWYVARSVDGKQHDTGRVERVDGGFLASTYLVEEAQFIADALNWATAYRAPATSAAAMTGMVDAAMVEMANITPPLRRSECERLIRAAMQHTPAAKGAGGVS